jgi:hypothetical protein
MYHTYLNKNDTNKMATAPIKPSKNGLSFTVRCRIYNITDRANKDTTPTAADTFAPGAIHNTSPKIIFNRRDEKNPAVDQTNPVSKGSIAIVKCILENSVFKNHLE